MTERPRDHDTQPKPDQPRSADGILSAASRGSTDMDASSQFRHELRNLLQAILIQVQCARMSLDNEDTAATRNHLGHIESSVGQSRQVLDKFVPPRHKR